MSVSYQFHVLFLFIALRTTNIYYRKYKNSLKLLEIYVHLIPFIVFSLCLLLLPYPLILRMLRSNQSLLVQALRLKKP